MAFVFVAGDLVRLGLPTASSSIGEPGLYIVSGASGGNVTLIKAEGGIVEQGVGIVVPTSRVTSHWASA